MIYKLSTTFSTRIPISTLEEIENFSSFFDELIFLLSNKGYYIEPKAIESFFKRIKEKSKTYTSLCIPIESSTTNEFFKINIVFSSTKEQMFTTFDTITFTFNQNIKTISVFDSYDDIKISENILDCLRVKTEKEDLLCFEIGQYAYDRHKNKFNVNGIVSAIEFYQNLIKELIVNPIIVVLGFSINSLPSWNPNNKISEKKSLADLVAFLTEKGYVVKREENISYTTYSLYESSYLEVQGFKSVQDAIEIYKRISKRSLGTTVFILKNFK